MLRFQFSFRVFCAFLSVFLCGVLSISARAEVDIQGSYESGKHDSEHISSGWPHWSNAGETIPIGNNTHLVEGHYLFSDLWDISSSTLKSGMVFLSPYLYGWGGVTIANKFPSVAPYSLAIASGMIMASRLFLGGKAFLYGTYIAESVSSAGAGIISSHMSRQLCGKRNGIMPVFIENPWLASHFHIQMKFSQGSMPSLRITPLPGYSEEQGQRLPDSSVSPAWLDLFNLLSEQSMESLYVSVEPHGEVTGKTLWLEVSKHDNTPNYQFIKSVPVNAQLWDLEYLQDWCPQTQEPVVSALHPENLSAILEILKDELAEDHNLKGHTYVFTAHKPEAESGATLFDHREADKGHWLVHSNQGSYLSSLPGVLLLADAVRQPKELLEIAGSANAEQEFHTMSAQKIWHSEYVTTLKHVIQFAANLKMRATLGSYMNQLDVDNLAADKVLAIESDSSYQQTPDTALMRQASLSPTFVRFNELKNIAASMAIEAFRPFHEEVLGFYGSYAVSKKELMKRRIGGGSGCSVIHHQTTLDSASAEAGIEASQQRLIENVRSILTRDALKGFDWAVFFRACSFPSAGISPNKYLDIVLQESNGKAIVTKLYDALLSNTGSKVKAGQQLISAFAYAKQYFDEYEPESDIPSVTGVMALSNKVLEKVKAENQQLTPTSKLEIDAHFSQVEDDKINKLLAGENIVSILKRPDLQEINLTNNYGHYHAAAGVLYNILYGIEINFELSGYVDESRVMVRDIIRMTSETQLSQSESIALAYFVILRTEEYGGQPETRLTEELVKKILDFRSKIDSEAYREELSSFLFYGVQSLGKASAPAVFPFAGMPSHQPSTVQHGPSEPRIPLDLRNLAGKLSRVMYKIDKISVQLGIPIYVLKNNKNQEPSFFLDYWLSGNVSNSDISWNTVIKALKSAYVGEPGLARQLEREVW